MGRSGKLGKEVSCVGGGWTGILTKGGGVRGILMASYLWVVTLFCQVRMWCGVLLGVTEGLWCVSVVLSG